MANNIVLGELNFAPSVLATFGGDGSFAFDGSPTHYLRLAGDRSTVNLDVATSWPETLEVDVNNASLLNWTPQITETSGDMVKRGTGTLRLRGRNASWNGNLLIQNWFARAFCSG